MCSYNPELLKFEHLSRQQKYCLLHPPSGRLGYTPSSGLRKSKLCLWYHQKMCTPLPSTTLVFLAERKYDRNFGRVWLRTNHPSKASTGKTIWNTKFVAWSMINKDSVKCTYSADIYEFCSADMAIRSKRGMSRCRHCIFPFGTFLCHYRLKCQGVDVDSRHFSMIFTQQFVRISHLIKDCCNPVRKCFVKIKRTQKIYKKQDEPWIWIGHDCNVSVFQSTFQICNFLLIHPEGINVRRNVAQQIWHQWTIDEWGQLKMDKWFGAARWIFQEVFQYW